MVETFKLSDIKEDVRLLICGDRHWWGFQSIKNRLKDLRDSLKGTLIDMTVITGGCSGADQQADKAAEELGIDRIIFPANWVGRKKAAGPVRNSKMLREGKPTLCWAFHKDISKSKGTKDMVARCKAKEIPTEVFTQ